MSSEPPKSVADTVVVLNFLLVEEWQLLVTLIGRPIAVPRIVYDPESGDVPEIARSEITKRISFDCRVADDPARDEAARSTARRCLDRVTRITEHHSAGDVVVLDLSDGERELLGRLASPQDCHGFGLHFPLHPGEAACIALSAHRDLVFVTDDNDALTAMSNLVPGHPYERTRKLLVRAARERLITKERANGLHDEMRRLGFWDTEPPFP